MSLLLILTDFIYSAGVSIGDFKQVNAGRAEVILDQSINPFPPAHKH